MKRPSLVTVAAIVAVLAAAGCARQESTPVAAGGERIENPAMGLALAHVPEPFVLDANSAERLAFTTSHETGGLLEFAVGPPENGLNLQAAVQQRGDAFRAKPGGNYNGSRELGTPWGPAYYSRGSYDAGSDDADGGREEQTWIFALHPTDSSRPLTLTYTYPEGEGQERVHELLGILGEVEGLLFAAPDEARTEPDAAE